MINEETSIKIKTCVLCLFIPLAYDKVFNVEDFPHKRGANQALPNLSVIDASIDAFIIQAQKLYMDR